MHYACSAGQKKCSKGASSQASANIASFFFPSSRKLDDDDRTNLIRVSFTHSLDAMVFH